MHLWQDKPQFYRGGGRTLAFCRYLARAEKILGVKTTFILVCPIEKRKKEPDKRKNSTDKDKGDQTNESNNFNRP